MTSLVAILFSSFVIALSGAMMPGPLLTITISESSRCGSKTGPLLILGHGMLELILVSALVLGLAPFLQKESVFITVAITGSVILFWMSFRMLWTLPRLSIQWNGEQPKQNHLVIAGIVMSLANPYWMIWWASIGLGYILYSMKFGYLGVLFFFLGHITADFVWYALISLAVGHGRRHFSYRLYRRVVYCCAAFLAILAGYFAWSGIARIFM